MFSPLNLKWKPKHTFFQYFFFVCALSVSMSLLFLSFCLPLSLSIYIFSNFEKLLILKHFSKIKKNSKEQKQCYCHKWYWKLRSESFRCYIQFNILLHVVCISLACHHANVTCMLFVCARMPSVCHSYVVVCHPYVTRMYSYVIRMYSFVVLRWSKKYVTIA